MLKQSLLLFILFCVQCVYAQQAAPPRPKKLLTLEEIWNSKIFREKTVRDIHPLNDGASFTATDENNGIAEVNKYSFKNGKKQKTLLVSSGLIPAGGKEPVPMDDYWFNFDETKMLLSSETDHIFRHSSQSKYYVYNLKSSKLTQLSNDKLQVGTFSPVEDKIAYVKGNNLFLFDMETGRENQITTDGKKNFIINGRTDWVYEEEFAFDKAFFWSPDGKKIAFYKFDESRVKEYFMPKYDTLLYPESVSFKYPKAGEENAKVSVYVYDLVSGNITIINIGKEYEYIPRVKWTANPNVLAFEIMNRLQNKLTLLMWHAATGEVKELLNEESETYIDIHDNLIFIPDKDETVPGGIENNGFLWTSEQDGYNHIYYYDMYGTRLRQLTEGKWDVSGVKGFEESTQTVFYVSDEVSPRQRDIYSIKLDGSGKFKITTVDGTHDCIFSKGYNFFIDFYSNANTPPETGIYNALGDKITVLESNSVLRDTLRAYKISNKKFFIFKTSDGMELNAWLINPPDFDRSKKYPVFIYVYGGPGAQTVLDRWEGKNYLWHQLLAQKGYIVISVDNRGTGGRGRDFKNCTYKRLGKTETADFIETAKYLAKLPTVDKSRIGIMGWSYGGYMSSLCILNGSDYFKTAIAVAPVTHWKFYDTIYTERYMQTPEENKTGYEESSPLNYTDSLKGKFLLIHGTADDNVHFQNTAEMVSALTKANKQFDLFVYPDKNHGISGGNTRLHLYTKMLDFIRQNL